MAARLGGLLTIDFTWLPCHRSEPEQLFNGNTRQPKMYFLTRYVTLGQRPGNGGHYRIRTCDRLRVKELRYRCAKRPKPFIYKHLNRYLEMPDIVDYGV